MTVKENVSTGLNDDDLSESVWWASVDESTQDQTVFLYRKEGGQNSLLDRLTISPDSMPCFDDFLFEIKELHGGGVYEAVIRRPNGTLAKRVPFSLAGLPKRVAAEPVAVPVTENSTEKLITLLIQQGQQTQQQFLAGLQQLGEKIAAKPEVDPFLMFERAASLMGKTGATPPPPKSVLEQMLELKQVQELFANGEALATGADSWGSLAAALVPLTEMMKENTINERLKLEMVKKAQEQKALAAPKPQQAQAPQAAPIAQTAQAALLAEFKPVLAQVVPYAEQGSDPIAVANAILQIAPDKTALYEFLNREDALSDMATLEPKVEQHWDWFTALANAIIEQIDGQQVQHETGTTAQAEPVTEPTQPQATNSKRPNGNTSDTATHGATGTKRTRKPSHTPTSPTVS